MRMHVTSKNISQLTYAMTVQVWSLIRFGQKIPQFRFILKLFSFSVWVPIYEERKANPRKPFLFLKNSGSISTVFRSVENLFHAIYVHFTVFVLLLTFIRILLICSSLLV
jgi:uncharacterized membrane protein